MPFEDTKISELNQCQKSDKAPFIIAIKLDIFYYIFYHLFTSFFFIHSHLWMEYE